MSRLFLSFIIFFIAAAVPSVAAISVEGTALPVVSVQPETSSGLAGLYVVSDFSGCRIVYTAASAAASVSVQRYGLRGAAYPSEILPEDLSRDGAVVTVTNITADGGYIFTEGSRATYCWISSYALSPVTLSSIYPDESQSYCDRLTLRVDGDAPRMIYYGIDGRSYTIDREITLSYTTLEPVTDPGPSFATKEVAVNYPYIDGSINIAAPLSDTYFTIAADRFLRAWGRELELVSPRAVSRTAAIVTAARQFKDPGASELSPSDATLGGSAPVEIEFEAAVSDAVTYTRWQIATDPEFINVEYYTPDLRFRHTFTDAGQRYVMFEGADASGECTAQSDIYTISIGESSLRCPNAFSPGASAGVNDEWRVTYQSIIHFECYIFNRWGEKMAELHDPSQGWDGIYHGKLVPAGVYYYVIKATGADGKEYELAGDINILRSSAQ